MKKLQAEEARVNESKKVEQIKTMMEIPIELVMKDISLNVNYYLVPMIFYNH